MESSPSTAARRVSARNSSLTISATMRGSIVFGEQRAHHAGQCCPCSRQSGGVRGVLDPVVEVDRGGGAQLQQVTRRQNAHQRAGIVAHGKVANFQPVHAPDGAVGECSGADAGERPRGDGADRQVQRMPRRRWKSAASRRVR